MTGERMPVEVMGLTLGTADGWDDHGDFMLQYYDFQPDITIFGLEPGDLVFSFTKGVIERYDDAGEVAMRVDMLDTLARAREALSMKASSHEAG